MGRPVIVEAVRTPIGKQNGQLASLHPTHALGIVFRELFARTGVAPADVGQVIGGCVTQVGEQSFNVTRMAWLAAGLPHTVGATTIDCQCGSSQQANHFVSNLIASGVIDVGIACGVEIMSRVPIGANTSGPGSVKPPGFPHELPHQFVAAERIAQKYAVTREDADAYACLSQARAAQATETGRLAREIVSVEIAGSGGVAIRVERDEGIRPTTMEGLARLRTLRASGIHTAGNVSQISDGAAAILWMDEDRARSAGLTARAWLRSQCLVGSDPYLHIEGPIDATRALVSRSGLSIGDVDRFEINEAFAAVVLAWTRAFEVDIAKINPNGGAIALGHPMGATGARLLTTALHELERNDLARALITMCCGSAVATGTILERC